MTVFPPPELLSKSERKDAAEALGLTTEEFEAGMDPNALVDYEGERITMGEWKKRRENPS